MKVIHLYKLNFILVNTVSFLLFLLTSSFMSIDITHIIRISVGEREIIAELDNTKASMDFISMLPLSIEISDYASTEKVFDLPNKLNISNEPDGYDPSVGDITYYSPWGNIAIFYKDFGYAKGLVKLGRITKGGEHLKLLNGIGIIELIK